MRSLIGTTFGAQDMPPCPRYSGRMFLTRRSPHQRLGERFEEQRFTCTTCGYETMRSVDENGSGAADDQDRSSAAGDETGNAAADFGSSIQSLPH